MERSFFAKTGGSRPSKPADFANERRIPGRPFINRSPNPSSGSEAPFENNTWYRQADNEIARSFLRKEGDTYAHASSVRLSALWEAFLSKDNRATSSATSLLEIAQELAIAKNLVHDQPMSVEQRSALTAQIAPMNKRLSQEPYATQLREERLRFGEIRTIFLRGKTLRSEQQHRDFELQRPAIKIHEENQPLSQAELNGIVHDIQTCLSRYAESHSALTQSEGIMLDELKNIIFDYEARPIQVRERLQQRHISLQETASPKKARDSKKDRLEMQRRARIERETPQMRIERKRFEELNHLIRENPRLYVAYHDLLQNETTAKPLEPPEHTLLHRVSRYHALEKLILNTLEESPATEDLPFLLAEPPRTPFSVDDLRTQTTTVLKRLNQQLLHPVIVDTLEAEEQQWTQLYAAYTAAIHYKEDTAFVIDQDALGPIKGNLVMIFEALETLMNVRLDQLLKGCLDALHLLGAQITTLENNRPVSPSIYQKNYSECSTVLARIRRRFDGIVINHPLIKTREQSYHAVLSLIPRFTQRLDQLTPQRERSESAFA